MKNNKIIFSFALLIFISTIGFAADTYAPDPAHSQVFFTAKHLVISKVSGRFKDFSATVVYDAADISKSSLSGTIKTASITTDNDGRDEHLKSPEFFDVEKYPEITFQSTQVSKKGKEVWVTGNLTMHGVTKQVSFPVEITGPIKDPRGKMKMGIEAHLTVKRLDYGIAWNKKMDDGGLVVSDEIEITINSEMAQQQPEEKKS